MISWFDVRGREIGTWAFVLNRLTGLGLVLYLGLHFIALSLLARGESAYNDFVEFAHHPIILFMDVVLLFGVIFHGLNGIRVALVGMGIGVHKHKTMLIVLSCIGAVLVVLSAWLVLTS
jgi:succinate dehydrogenase / fumarate reductase cytochrome b subunit